MTQGQYYKVMEEKPSGFQNCGENCPVERVSWDDAQKFIKKLNQMEKTDKYRLPTEAEWEYACRANSKDRWSFGDDEADLEKYAWYDKNSKDERHPEGKTHPVGKREPNAWGLYDMHGNVWEWVQDRYGDYPAGPVTDPKGPATGDYRVLRGGSYGANARELRSAERRKEYYLIHNRDYYGFRVARDK